MDKWKQAQEHLRSAMEQEISILRQILGNFSEEELSLAHNNAASLSSIRAGRAELLKNLGSQRKKRLRATQTIRQLAHIPKQNQKVELENFLPEGDINTSDILSLREQIRSLHDKLHEQKIRNHYLVQKGIYLKPQPEIKKKSSIATFEQSR